MEIHQATLKDIDYLNELTFMSKGYWGHNDEFMDSYMAEFKITESDFGRGDIFIASEKNRIIGFYGFLKDGEDLELDNFFLHPDFIGKGKGRELWQLCLKTAYQYGVQEFKIWSDPNAEGFYLKMGCKKIGEEYVSLFNRFSPILKYTINA